MGYRIERDETKLSDAQLLAWEIVLPYKHVPIIDSDTTEANELTTFLNSVFSKKALKEAVIQMRKK